MNGPAEISERDGSFPTTHWSVVVHAGAGSESQARTALELLCRQYWYPLYSFVRRQGCPHHDAEDCTQAFIARLLAREGMTQARPELGRFRSFLLTALRHYQINEWRGARAEKRGGGAVVLSLDAQDARQRFAHEPVDPGFTPEQAFDRNWACSLIENTLGGLELDYRKRDLATLFTELTPFVWETVAPGALAAPAGRAGLSVHAFTVALQRLRRRVGERLRAAVAQTVADPADVDDELRHLIAVLRGPATAG